MSSLAERLRTDLAASMKERDALRTGTLRMALTAIHEEEVAGKQARTLTDDEVLRVLTRETKKRREAAEAFDGGGRAELAAKERAEGEVLSAYLPAQLSDEELDAIVTRVLAEQGLSGKTSIGPAMKAVNAALAAGAGSTEGGRVAASVRRQLG
ncbi:MAG TPA: GatB/YqeY domain-containing protein [Frankiaceae bacterium]|nr:GatB/YqeY domain-containing protein [Frankiaceae bacterium]